LHQLWPPEINKQQITIQLTTIHVFKGSFSLLYRLKLNVSLAHVSRPCTVHW